VASTIVKRFHDWRSRDAKPLYDDCPRWLSSAIATVRNKHDGLAAKPIYELDTSKSAATAV
jgi:hypothetical protein